MRSLLFTGKDRAILFISLLISLQAFMAYSSSCYLSSINPPMSAIGKQTPVTVNLFSYGSEPSSVQLLFNSHSINVVNFDKIAYPKLSYESNFTSPVSWSPGVVEVTSPDCEGTLLFQYFDYDEFQFSYNSNKTLKLTGGNSINIEMTKHSWLLVYNTFTVRYESVLNPNISVTYSLSEDIFGNRAHSFVGTTYQDFNNIGSVAKVLVSFDNANYHSLGLNVTFIATTKLKVAVLYLGDVKDGGWTYAQNLGKLAASNYFGNSVQFRTFTNVMFFGNRKYVENIIESDAYDLVIMATDVGRSELGYYGDKYPHIKFATVSMEFLYTPQTTSNLIGLWATLYEARYLAGVVAGLVISKGGYACYIKAWDNPEVNLGINAFALGMQKHNPTAKLLSITINTWGDIFLENEVSNFYLTDGRCELLSQHSDHADPLELFVQQQKYVIGSNSDMRISIGEYVATSAIFNWELLYRKVVEAVINEQRNFTVFSQGLREEAVKLAPISGLLSDRVRKLVNEEQNNLLGVGSENYLFCGPIYDNTGILKIPSGRCGNSADFSNMNWSVSGIYDLGSFVAIPPGHHDSHIDSQIVLGAYVILAMIYALSIALIVWLIYYHGHPVIKFAQPKFLLVNIIGCMVGVSTVIPLSFSPHIHDMLAYENKETFSDLKFPSYDSACQAIPWCLVSAFCLTLPVLFAKTWRQHQILSLSKNTMQRKAVRATNAIVHITLFFILCLIPVIVWQVMDPLVWVQRVTEFDEFDNPIQSTGFCTSQNVHTYIAVLVSLVAAVLIAGNVVCYFARSDDSFNNESLWITLSQANYLQTSIIAALLLALTRSNATARFVVCALALFCGFSGNLMLMLFPKVIAVHRLFKGKHPALSIEAILPKGNSTNMSLRPNHVRSVVPAEIIDASSYGEIDIGEGGIHDEEEEELDKGENGHQDQHEVDQSQHGDQQISHQHDQQDHSDQNAMPQNSNTYRIPLPTKQES